MGLTLIDNDVLAEKWNAGIRTEEIAIFFGVTSAAITRTAKALNLPPRHRGRQSAEEIKRQARKVTARLSYAEVEELMERERLTYRQALCRLHRRR